MLLRNFILNAVAARKVGIIQTIIIFSYIRGFFFEKFEAAPISQNPLSQLKTRPATLYPAGGPVSRGDTLSARF
jgi:hypothetical protein